MHDKTGCITAANIISSYFSWSWYNSPSSAAVAAAAVFLWMEISAGVTAARLAELELGLALLDAGPLVPFPALLTVRERRE